MDYYFGKKALGVDIYDDYGRLLDPNMGLPAEVRTGGDQLGGEGLSVVPTKTVALFVFSKNSKFWTLEPKLGCLKGVSFNHSSANRF